MPKIGNICYRKKSIDAKTFIGGMFEELKNTLHEPIINYTSFVEPQIIEDVDGLAVSSYPMDKNNLIKNNEDVPSF